MTETGYGYYPGQGEETGYGYYPGDDSLVSEDAETVNWVDQTLNEAEQGGFLEELGVQVESYTFTDTTGFADAVEQARTTAGESLDTPPSTPNREAIREAIFAKLRRPDGAPFAAGYTTGPAARLPMYEGEDTKTGWRGTTNPNSDVITTVYEDRNTIGERASDVDAQGRVLDANGRLVADGQWGWVIDEETGALLLFNPSAAMVVNAQGVERPKRSDENFFALLAAGYKIRATHHTTPVHGMPVTGAGLMRIEDGYIAEITDESGHYRPEAPQQYTALQALMDEGYSLDQAKVRLTGASMGARPTDKAEWLNEARQTNPDFPTGDVTLRPEQFMQTEGDEYQIRMKQALNEQIKARGETPPTTETEDAPEDDTFVGTDGRLKRMVPDPNNPAYTIQVDAEPPSGATETYVVDDDNYNNTDVSSDISSDDDNYNNADDNYNNELRDTEEGDNSAEDPDAAFINQARAYLAAAGRSGFAEWFRTLSQEHQTLLLADPEIGSAWRAENAPSRSQWQPADNDHAAAATANAAFVDDLDDRQSAVFELGGFSLLIGDGHDARHLAYVQDAADHVTGRVTVRKAGVGRGAGSLTFTGVPPAKQGVVQEAVARFSRKEVRFG